MGRSVTHFLSLLSLLGFTACSGDDAVSDTALVPVVFTPRIEGAFTRVVDQTWSAGDKVGIAMLEGSTLSAFIPYKVSIAGDATNVDLIPVDNDGVLFYPANGNKVTFVAFSPYTTVTSNTVTYSLIDQETQEDMEKVDFLYHKGTTEYNRYSITAATLNFTHKFSKLVITVTTSEDATAINLSNLAVTISGTPGSATVDLTTGLPTTLGDAAPITSYYDTSSHVATAIVVPHGARAGRTITFTGTPTAGGGTVTPTYALPPDIHPFVSGKEYGLSFRITRRGVALVDAAIVKQ
jgi:hypothetical protein